MPPPPHSTRQVSNRPAPKSAAPASSRSPICDEPFLEFMKDCTSQDANYHFLAFEDPADAGCRYPGWQERGNFAVPASSVVPPPRPRAESGTFPSLTPLADETLHELLDMFDEFMGYSFDAARVIQEMGYQRDRLPSSLAPLLVVELSKRLHPARRPEFLKAASGVIRERASQRSVYPDGRAIA